MKRNFNPYFYFFLGGVFSSSLLGAIRQYEAHGHYWWMGALVSFIVLLLLAATRSNIE
jgi:hypothetical protein